MHLPSSLQCGAILHCHATRHESKCTHRAAIMSSTPTLGRLSLVSAVSIQAHAALQETLEAVEAENAEKQQLGTGKNYDRSLP